MGCIYNRGTRAKPNFWIKWTGRDGRPKYQKIGPDRALAKNVLAKKEHELTAKKHGLELEPGTPVPTFDAAADAFLERRKAVGVDGQPMVRSWREDRSRLKQHLRGRLGRLHLDEITDDRVRKLIGELRSTLKPQSIRNCLTIVSRIFNDQPRALRLTNPVAALDRYDRKSIGAGWDPKKTPWLRTEQVRAVYLALPELAPKSPWRAMFALGTFAGLRTGEVVALEWNDLDFAARNIHVQRSVEGPLKDNEGRFVPMAETLADVISKWRKLAPEELEQLFVPTGRGGRKGAGKRYVKAQSLSAVLRDALVAANVPEKLRAMRWYEATRHSFASRWVTEGGSLHKLAAILGHSTTEVTRRYAHLEPGAFTERERALVDVSLAPTKILPLSAPLGA
jgi:integrase